MLKIIRPIQQIVGRKCYIEIGVYC